MDDLQARSLIVQAARVSPRGKALVLLAPANSAAQVTLARSTDLVALLRPHHGRFALDGTVLLDTARGDFVPPAARRRGVVFQDARLFPHLSVTTNLRYGPRRAPRAALPPAPAADGRAPRRTRCIAPGRGAALPGRLRDVARLPILCVTHALDEVDALADTLVLLEGGYVRAAGPLEALAARTDLPLAQRRDGAWCWPAPSWTTTRRAGSRASASRAARLPCRCGKTRQVRDCWRAWMWRASCA
jgi:molybdate transport system ATP-binding protein